MVRQILFTLLVFVTNIIQAITGFAGTLLAMPAGIRLIGIHASRAILNAMGLAASILIVLSFRRDIDRRQLLRITCAMGIGILIGLGLMQILELDFLLTLYGLFVVGYALFKMLSRRNSSEISRTAGAVILILAGVVHGMFISGGSLLVIYAVNALPEKRTFRATLSGVWIILNGFLMVQHIVSGYFTPEVTHLTLLCLIPLCLGVFLGTRLQEHVRQRTFLRLTYVLLLVSGCLILF